MPNLYRYSAFACFVSIMLLTGWTYKPSAAHAHRAFNSRSIDIETDILFYVNEYRGKKGLPALVMNDYMSSQAEKHSEDMASNKVAFGHDGFEERVKSITNKIGNIHASAENVAYGNLTPKQVVDVWLKSPGHRKNIEGNYSLTGIGIASGNNNVTFFTQIFTSK